MAAAVQAPHQATEAPSLAYKQVPETKYDREFYHHSNYTNCTILYHC